MPASSRLSPLVVWLAGLSVTGCPDAAGEFDEFVERWERANPGADGAIPDAGECIAPEATAIDGQYAFALSAVIARETPIVFLTQITGQTAPEPALSFQFQPLSAQDRRTPVGQPVGVGPFPLSPDGALRAELPPLVVTGEANPITGGEIEAQIVLEARFCGVSDFYCGTVSGSVSRPLTIGLAGSTFAMERVQDGATPEQPFLSCNRDLAAPL